MKPSVGRIVHYQSYGTPGGEYQSLARAAVITYADRFLLSDDQDENNYTISLCILNPTGQFFTQNVKYSAQPKAGCWNWPPKV